VYLEIIGEFASPPCSHVFFIKAPAGWVILYTVGRIISRLSCLVQGEITLCIVEYRAESRMFFLRHSNKQLRVSSAQHT